MHLAPSSIGHRQRKGTARYLVFLKPTASFIGIAHGGRRFADHSSWENHQASAATVLARIVINRPARRNAFRHETRRGLVLAADTGRSSRPGTADRHGWLPSSAHIERYETDQNERPAGETRHRQPLAHQQVAKQRGDQSQQQVVRVPASARRAAVASPLLPPGGPFRRTLERRCALCHSLSRPDLDRHRLRNHEHSTRTACRLAG